jgi:acyl-CoA thioesterase-1
MYAGLRSLTAATACCALMMTADVGTAPAASGPSLRVVTLGTSLTAGGGWQEPLQAALASCLGGAIEVINVGRHGATSAWGLAQAERVAKERPDILLIEFAVNDAALYRWISLEGSRRAISDIIAAVRAERPDARIVVMHMNPIRGWRSWLRPRRAQFEEAHRQLARELGADDVDFTARWNALSEAEMAEAIPDGTHPVPAATRRIVVPELVQVLSNGVCGGGESARAGGNPSR